MQLPLKLLQQMSGTLMTTMTDHVVSQFRDKARGIFLKSGVLQTAKLHVKEQDQSDNERLANELLLEAHEASARAGDKLRAILRRVSEKMFTKGRTRVPFPLNPGENYSKTLNDDEFGLVRYLSYVSAFLSKKCAKRVFESTVPPLKLFDRNELMRAAVEYGGFPEDDDDDAEATADGVSVQALGFDFAVPPPLEFSFWTAPPLVVVDSVQKPTVAKSMAELYGFKVNDVVFDLKHFATQLTASDPAKREWDLMRCIFHLEEQETFVRQLSKGGQPERPVTAPPRAANDTVDIGMLHMGKQRVRLDQVRRGALTWLAGCSCETPPGMDVCAVLYDERNPTAAACICVCAAYGACVHRRTIFTKEQTTSPQCSVAQWRR